MSQRCTFRLIAMAAVATVLSAGPWAVALSRGATSGRQLPKDPAEAMAVFENDVEEWGNGPVSYLFLPEELEEWKELETDEERREFIQWFWGRRDDDLRDSRHLFKEGFYTRVAHTNRRFSEFPRGWRSDRGRVWIILGSPDSATTDFATDFSAELEIWTYNTYGGILRSAAVITGEASALGEMQIAFINLGPGTREIYGGVGRGGWPHYLYRAFEIVRKAVVLNPTLKRQQ